MLEALHKNSPLRKQNIANIQNQNSKWWF